MAITVVSSDSEIIERSMDTPSVFAELYDRHARAIFRYAARRIGPHAADDMMSETFLVAFERRAGFDPAVGAALPWLYGIATTLMRKHARLEVAAWRGRMSFLRGRDADAFSRGLAGPKLDSRTCRSATAEFVHR
jgi:DNA-directed RNA polymerase specialized sigma24 family protein